MARTDIEPASHARQLTRRWATTSAVAGAGLGVVYAVGGAIVGVGELVAGLVGMGTAVLVAMAAGRSHGILRRMLLASVAGLGAVSALVLLVR